MIPKFVLQSVIHIINIDIEHLDLRAGTRLDVCMIGGTRYY
jgi:hypothetical protein